MPSSPQPVTDLTVELGKRSATDLVAALDVAGFVESTRVLPFLHRASRMPLDVVLAGPGLEEQFLAGAREQLVGDVPVPVVCAEDLVAMKVLAGRARDLDDVAVIARVRRDDLDLDGSGARCACSRTPSTGAIWSASSSASSSPPGGRRPGEGSVVGVAGIEPTAP